ncbi:MAG: NAD-dependent epimerase/dehydratase family protein [Chloroflexota bacterium]|nr:NAD-dependent epimerase/dehydratase family protein [Chloroflexota bacterium]
MPSGLIIGITGFTGSALARRLVAAGWDVRGIDEHEDAAPELDELGVTIELADVGDPDELEDLGRDGDHVFYVMRSVSDTEDDMERRTIRGVMNVVEALEGIEIGSFVYGSTMAVYGSGSPDTLTEESPLRPNTVLGRLNVETEDYLLEQHETDGFPARIVRAGTVYGPGGGTLESLRGGNLRLIGGGKNPTSRIHVEDAAAIIEAVASRGRSGDVYLAVDDDPAPTSEYLRYLAAQAGARPPRSSPKHLVQGLVKLHEGFTRLTRTKASISSSLFGLVTGSYPASNAKVRRELGVELRYPTYVEGAASLLELDVHED